MIPLKSVGSVSSIALFNAATWAVIPPVMF